MGNGQSRINIDFFSNILTRKEYSVLRVGGIRIGVKGIVFILFSVNMFQLHIGIIGCLDFTQLKYNY